MQQSINTRARLIEQNKKLRGQIVQLSSQVDEVIQKKGTVAVAKQQPPDAELEVKKKQLRNQQTYIAKLKGKIQDLRNSVIVGVDSVNRKEQDTVTHLRKELKMLEEEKATLLKLQTEKTKVLKVRDSPHEQLRAQLEDLIASAKLESRELLDKCAPLQRQVRRDHEMVVAQKEALKQASSADLEKLLPGLENDIRQAEQQKKAIEDKWQGKLEYLDTQLLQLRTVFDAKKRRYDELTKQLKNWEIRKYVYRDQDAIKEVQDRLARLQVKPRSQTHTSKNNGGKTSVSMMESKPGTEEIRRSTSKDRFDRADPSPKVKESSTTVKDKPNKNLFKSMALNPSKELPAAAQQKPKKSNEPQVMKKDIQQQTPVKQAESIIRQKKQKERDPPNPTFHQSPPAPQTIELLKSHNQSNSKTKPRELQVSKTEHLKPLKVTQKHPPNEFIEQIEEYPQQEPTNNPTKQKRLLKSIAVGTSFYYNHEM